MKKYKYVIEPRPGVFGFQVKTPLGLYRDLDPNYGSEHQAAAAADAARFFLYHWGVLSREHEYNFPELVKSDSLAPSQFVLDIRAAHEKAGKIAKRESPAVMALRRDVLSAQRLIVKAADLLRPSRSQLPSVDIRTFCPVEALAKVAEVLGRLANI